MLTALPAAQAAQLHAAKAPSANALQRSRVLNETYILGPGDRLQVELLDIPELSGTFSIGPDGTMYLPRLRALYVEGLTVEELRYFLTQQFRAYVKNPQVYVNPVRFRPVRVYVGGEIIRPGYYTLFGGQLAQDPLDIAEPQTVESTTQQGILGLAYPKTRSFGIGTSNDVAAREGVAGATPRWPTLFDSLRAAQGVTPFSNLGQVQVVRN